MENTGLTWRKSSYSGQGGSNCIEVASDGTVMVRDTTDRSGPVLPLSTAAWEKFTAQLKRSLSTPQPNHTSGCCSLAESQGSGLFQKRSGKVSFS